MRDNESKSLVYDTAKKFVIYAGHQVLL